MIDLHTHTSFSDGACTAMQLIDKAIKMGITQLAITDHYDTFDPGFKTIKQDPQLLALHFNTIKQYAKDKPIAVYCGVETSTDENGRLLLPRQVIAQSDVIITSVHYIENHSLIQKGDYLNDSYWNKYKQKLIAQAAGRGDILGHPEAYLPIAPMLESGTTFKDRLQICSQISEKYFDLSFITLLGESLLKSNKAYEMHGASNTPREWVVCKLGKMGVRFSIGSDAHSLDMLGCNSRAMALCKEHKLQLYIPS